MKKARTKVKKESSKKVIEEAKQNMNYIDINLINFLYKNGKINTPTYKAIMQKVKDGVYCA